MSETQDGPALPTGLPAALVRFSSWLNAIGTVGILLLMVLVNADILGREMFSTPVRGTTELLALSIVAIVFLTIILPNRDGMAQVGTAYQTDETALLQFQDHVTWLTNAHAVILLLSFGALLADHYAQKVPLPNFENNNPKKTQ